MYLGVAVVVLVITASAIIWVDVANLRQGVNSSLRPALAQTVQMMAEERSHKRSFNDAATYAIDHLGRPDLRLFYEPQIRNFGAFTPHSWLNLVAASDAVLLGFRYDATYIPGGRVDVGLNSASLIDRIAADVLRLLLETLLSLLIALALAQWIARRATRPLLSAAGALRALGDGDSTPNPMLASDLSEMSDLNAAYNAAAASIEKAVAERELAAESVRNFISDASHELKTPLTIIMGYVDAVSEGLVRDPEDAQRILKKTLGECRRMRSTIEKLIALARLDRDEAKVAPFDVLALVRQVAESMKPLAAELHVELGPDGTEAIVVGDEGDLREAIVNIVENAVKYAPGSPIDVRVSSAGDLVVLEIADAGPGIAEEDRDRVFERFHRGSSHPNVEGSGLGLAIAKRAVQRANGRITLTSELGRGTAVKLYLPAATGVMSAQSTA
jgi:two-component system, OmpR family, sensor kinase